MLRFYRRVCHRMLSDFVKAMKGTEGARGVFEFVVTSLGIGGAAVSAFAYSPLWWILVAILVLWLFLRSIYRVHVSVPSGDVVTGVRIALQQAAELGFSLREKPGTTQKECEIWHDKFAQYLSRTLGDAVANDFKRAKDGSGWIGFDGDGLRVFLYIHACWLKEKSELPTLTVLPSFNPYSGD